MLLLMIFMQIFVEGGQKFFTEKKLTREPFEVLLFETSYEDVPTSLYTIKKCQKPENPLKKIRTVNQFFFQNFYRVFR